MHEGQGFEQLVQCSESAWHDNEALGILHKHHLAHKEVIEIDALVRVDVGVVVLFERQFNVQSHGGAPDVMRTAVTGFHHTGTTTGDDTIASLTQLPRNFTRLIVHRRIFGHSCRSVDADAGSNALQGLKSLHEFPHDFKDGPTVVGLDFIPIALLQAFLHVLLLRTHNST